MNNRPVTAYEYVTMWTYRCWFALKQQDIILVHSGSISENEGRPTPTISECPRCKSVNATGYKYCISCSYPCFRQRYLSEKQDLSHVHKAFSIIFVCACVVSLFHSERFYGERSFFSNTTSTYNWVRIILSMVKRIQDKILRLCLPLLYLLYIL
jgi:hypothetical protein